ncbi:MULTISPECIES: S8 family serine peptidase [unclassified Mesorhizobium]|uniref:S8 family peptidase n=1 Tax=unclassified Mesorhizobium TaxID=325217 RepID=UPI000AC1FBC5|nr:MULTISPECIES: S8 family serine peptidase [unclassified Mesorhizobium]MBN9253249.1 S8 family serine peptidase [Mesorhizobium sp.]
MGDPTQARDGHASARGPISDVTGRVLSFVVPAMPTQLAPAPSGLDEVARPPWLDQIQKSPPPGLGEPEAMPPWSDEMVPVPPALDETIFTGARWMDEVNQLVHYSDALNMTKGEDITVAVLDTGCFVEHRDFSPSTLRIVAGVNCMTETVGGDITDATGHGSHVAGVLAANGVHIGLAPACRLVPVKVLSGTKADDGAAIGTAIARGLNWVLDNADTFAISVVCLSVGDNGNYDNDQDFAGNAITEAVQALAARNIPVVAAAGNLYGLFARDTAAQGMCFPAILREAISVGAVYDQPCDDFAGRPCRLGADYGSPSTDSSRPDQLAIYTQRMEKVTDDQCGTDIFAPGSWVRSTGIDGDGGSSVVTEGTSEAAPIVAGVIALLQSLHLKRTGERRPPIAMLRSVLRRSARTILDNSLVTSCPVTNKSFRRVDAFAALKQLELDMATS